MVILTVLIQAGSGAVTFGRQSRSNCWTAKDTLLATYNDLENVKTVMTNKKWNCRYNSGTSCG
jgi:glutamate-1-semialdehyde 2,1-aminomutase